MSNDSLSSTMILPNPGGRRSTSSEQLPPQPPAGIRPSGGIGALTEFNSENQLLLNSVELLLLAGNLRSLEPVGTIERLRTDVEKMISQLVMKLTDAAVPKDIIITCRYIVCCLMDELVLSTPWGVDSVWSQQTLLSKFHNETWGGEKFFLIVNKLLERPEQNIDLLELCYVCLSLGFKGKYRVSNSGEAEITKLSHHIVQKIIQCRPIGRELSPAWESLLPDASKSRFLLPRWLQFSILSLLVMLAYVLYLTNLHTQIDPVYQKLDAINYAQFSPVSSHVRQTDNATIIKTLRTELAEELTRKQLTITEEDGDVYIRFTDPAMFLPGAVELQQSKMPDVNKLVNAIKQFAKNVTLLGHTDSSGAQQSNWVISKKRAEAVALWLKSANEPLYYITTRGLADTKPLAANDTAANRSLNRRVEIVLQLKD